MVNQRQHELGGKSEVTWTMKGDPSPKQHKGVAVAQQKLASWKQEATVAM